MDITCDKCQTISSIPDAAIPDEGITFECPHCSAQLFAKLNSEEEIDLFGNTKSIDNIVEDKDLNELNPLSLDMDMSDQSLAVDLKELGDDDISPSMLYDMSSQEETKLELNKTAPPLKPSNNTKKFTKKEDLNNLPNDNINQVSLQTNTLDSYLSSRSASVQEQKSQVSPLLVILMIFLILGGATGYYFYFMKNKNLNKQITMTPKIKNTINSLYLDNPSIYKKVLNNISNDIASNPNHVLYKALYVYTAAKYFVSIETIIPSFAPDYSSYYKYIKKFETKSKFVKKAIVYYNLSLVLNLKKEIPNILKVAIQSLPVNDPDSLQLKAFIFYKNNNIKKLRKIISASNIDKKLLLPTYFILLKSEFINKQSISLTLNQINKINSKHIPSIFYNIQYLLSYNQLDMAKKELKKLQILKSNMNDYELTELYLFQARVAEKKLQIKEAYSFVKIAEDLKVENDKFFKEILNFYYRNYYNSAAISLLKNVYKQKYTKDFKISKLYIKLLIRDEDFGKAGQISTELRNKYPRKAEVYYLSALLSDSLENTIMAIDFLKKALSINNKYQDAVVLLAKQYQRKGKDKKARNLLETSVKDFKKNSLVKNGLALLYFRKKEYVKSLKLYNELLTKKDIDISNVNFRINMINYYLKKQSQEQTLNNLYKIYKLAPNFGELRIEIAKIEIKSKNYKKAILLLKEELKVRENNIKANLELGISYYYKKDYSSAEIYLNKTISIDSKNDVAFFYLGKSYAALNKFVKALDAYSNAYSYNKKNYDYLISVARTHVILNHVTEAFDSYAKLIKLKPTFDALYEYGSLFLKQSDSKNALRYFNLAYNINSKNTKLILEMGNLFFKNQNYKKSKKYYKKVIALDKKSSEAYYMIGETYRASEKFKKAVYYYLKAIKYNPNEGKYYYQLGYIYKSMRKYRKSLKTFKIYLKKEPNSPDKNEIMDEIYDLKHM